MKRIVAVFDLAGEPTPDDIRRAYDRFGMLGFSRYADPTLLPRMTVIGTWYDDKSIVEIRNAMMGMMTEAGMPLSHLLVVELNEAAWFGPNLDRA